MPAWTDERTEQTKKLWADGLSASQISAELNCGFSRCAVIGKLHRMGFTDRVRPDGTPRPPRAPRPPRSARPPARVPSLRRLPPIDMTFAPAPKPREGAVLGAAAAAVAVRDAECHWPLGDTSDPAFHFCCDQVEGDGPYCHAHYALAFDHAGTRRANTRERRPFRADVRR